MSKLATSIRRILLPLDISQDSLTALDVAFDLAAAIGGEVSGLFIEDAELLAAGSLPFAREVGAISGIRRKIGSSDIQHRFRAIAEQAQQSIAEAGRRRKVSSSFRVGRGDVTKEILTATGGADLVVLGKAGWSVSTFRKLGRTCLAMVSSSPVPVLIVERGASFGPPIFVVEDDTESGRRALEFARELHRQLGWELAVFSAQGMANGDSVLQRTRQEDARLIILPMSLPLTPRAPQLKCPVLFVP